MDKPPSFVGRKEWRERSEENEYIPGLFASRCIALLLLLGLRAAARAAFCAVRTRKKDPACATQCNCIL